MNYKKVKLCLDKGYSVTISDISAAAVNSKIHTLLLENLPPARLEVLAARAVRAQMVAVSGNAISQINTLLENQLICDNAWDSL